MFYIEKARQGRRKAGAMSHLGPAIVVFLAFMSITVWSWREARQLLNDTRQKIITQNADDVQGRIQRRLATYEDIIRAGVGLFNSSESVTRDEWQTFIEVLDVTNRYPGVQSVGFAKVIGANQLDDHIADMNSQGWNEYRVQPAGDRPEYNLLSFIEPRTERNLNSAGFDSYSSEIRRRALDLARDNGHPALTDQLVATVDLGADQQPAFSMYAPIYRRGSVNQTAEQRRLNIYGYIFAGFRTYSLFNQTIPENKYFGFKLYDGENPAGTLLYESTEFKRISGQADRAALTRQINIGNQTWTLEGLLDPEVISNRERERPSSVLWGGMIFSWSIAGFLYLLLLTRSRSQLGKENQAIQAAKDELLALASHQLRTPATGVKQYLGMLREGYAGKINQEQRNFIDKAYASNERQLATINEMLMVAKADAGNMELTIERFDLNPLVRDIIEEQLVAINNRRQKLTKHLPRTKSWVYADPRYIRMAIENIISNATKYTPEGGRLDIRLEAAKTMVKLVVKDTGVGVKPEDYHMLFQKFSRIPNELTNKVSGSGIGLYLADRIIRAHRGKLSFESTPGVGSTCSVSLSRRPPKAGKV